MNDAEMNSGDVCDEVESGMKRGSRRTKVAEVKDFCQAATRQAFAALG
jgi:hypothetical protein